MSKKRIPLFVASLIVVTALIGVRIWWINAHRIETPVQSFPMNQEIKLDGAFLDDISEDTNGYSLVVKKAQIMSANEYLQRYSRDDVKSVEGGDTPNTRVVLEVEFRNSGSTGAFNIISSWVTGKPSRNTYYRTDTELWEHRETKIGGNYAAVSIKDGTTYTTFIPFYMLTDPPFLSPYKEKASTYATINEKEFDYLIATKPQQMRVNVHV